MFSDPTGFSGTTDLTQQTLDFKTGGGKERELNIPKWHISDEAVTWLTSH